MARVKKVANRNENWLPKQNKNDGRNGSAGYQTTHSKYFRYAARSRLNAKSSGSIVSRVTTYSPMSGEPRTLQTTPTGRPGHKSPPGPRPTLGELQCTYPWTWLWCERCQHRAPFALAAAVIRWGANVSSDKLRQCVRCTACGTRGGTLQHPSWTGNITGFEPFPYNPFSSS